MTNDVSPQILLALVNDAWTLAPEQANTLRAQLLAEQSAALQFVKKGSLASVGKNSSNQSYKNYGPGTITHTQIVEAYSNILGLYDQLKSQITEQFEASADFDYEVPAGFDYDEPIYELLQKVFNAQSSGVASQLPDISSLRFPSSTPTGVLAC